MIGKNDLNEGNPGYRPWAPRFVESGRDKEKWRAEKREFSAPFDVLRKRGLIQIKRQKNLPQRDLFLSRRSGFLTRSELSLSPRHLFLSRSELFLSRRELFLEAKPKTTYVTTKSRRHEEKLSVLRQLS